MTRDVKRLRALADAAYELLLNTVTVHTLALECSERVEASADECDDTLDDALAELDEVT